MEAFRQNAALKDEIEIKRAVARGRRAVRDIEALSRLSKYRAMRRRYKSSVADDRGGGGPNNNGRLGETTEQQR